MTAGERAWLRAIWKSPGLFPRQYAAIAGTGGFTGQFKNHMSNFVDRGWVRRVHRGGYELTGSGREMVKTISGAG